MARGMRTLACAAVVVALMAGCGTIGDAVLNPHESKFSCEGKYKSGKCLTNGVSEAYENAKESAGGKEVGVYERPVMRETVGRTGMSATGRWDKRQETAPGDAPERVYMEKLYDKWGNLVDSPVSPMVTAPKYMRVLFVPTDDSEGVLHMPNYKYVIVEESHFVVGKYLMDERQRLQRKMHRKGNQ